MSRKQTRLEDLARIAGVSTATISRALNDSPSVNASTKKRIWEIAREHNYAFRPNMPAILSGAAATIAIVIPMPQGREGALADPFFMELVGAIGEAARENSCDVLISHLTPRTFDDLSLLVSANKDNGVIFLGQSLLHDRFNRLADQGHRFVVWGGEFDGQRYCSVGSDNVEGGRKATNHLLRLGRKHIAFLGDQEAPEVKQRYEGYRMALQAAGLEPEELLVQSSKFELESAEAAVQSLLTKTEAFDGVFGASDLVALGAIRALNKAGRRVPEDVSVVGYDNIHLARYNSPALSTISQDMNKAGRMLVSKLLSGAESRTMLSERLPTVLVVRESCGA